MSRASGLRFQSTRKALRFFISTGVSLWCGYVNVDVLPEELKSRELPRIETRESFVGCWVWVDPVKQTLILYRSAIAPSPQGWGI